MLTPHKPYVKKERKPTENATGDRYQVWNVVSALYCMLRIHILMWTPQTEEKESFRATHGEGKPVSSGMTFPSKHLDEDTRKYMKKYSHLWKRYRQAYAQIAKYVKPFIDVCLTEINNAVTADNLGDWCRKHMVEYITFLLQTYIELIIRERGKTTLSLVRPLRKVKWRKPKRWRPSKTL
jgi:hypothetical protein